MFLSSNSLAFLICASKQKNKKKEIKSSIFFQLARNREWKKTVYREGEKAQSNETGKKSWKKERRKRQKRTREGCVTTGN